jgi:hypothetical protein
LFCFRKGDLFFDGGDKDDDGTEQIKMLAKYMEDTSQNFYVFEPHGLLQKIRAMFQNSFEILIFIAMLCVSLYKPSFVSIVFLFLGHSILIPISNEAKSRMFWGRIISILLILLLLIEVIIKWRNLKTENSDWRTKHDFH